MVPLARLPGPKRLLRLFCPNLLTHRPLADAQDRGAAHAEEGPTRLKTGSSMASVAARTTGKYSGRQPAITALAAAFSTVMTRRRSGSSPITSSGERPEKPINSATRAVVGGITGKPSLQPNS